MPEPRRLLLVAAHATGGIGAHVASLAAGLPALGWQVTVVTSALTASRFDLTAGGAEVVTAWPPKPGNARRWRELVRAADVVHAHGHQAGVVATATAATLARRRRPRVIVSWHNAVLTPGRLGARAERFQARRADLVTGASQDLVVTAKRCGARRTELAPVASPPFPAGTRTVQPDGRRVVLTVSRIAPQKSLGTVVRAAELVAQKRSDVVWQVAGDGDEGLRAELEAEIARTGAPVELLGVRGDVPDLLASADAFALPSLWEARSLAVQEAMAAGLPIVATDTGGIPELLGRDGAAGVLVPVHGGAELAAAVLRVLGDPDLAAALGAEARRRYDRLPTERDVLSAWRTRYGQLVEG